ncbi:hypothetical protein E4U57_000703 [Claviceps arundinis]|uniref:RWD domain-containing protein n=1 Tax=Claviceps arundinis TaxID=1623583 RepID=A0ABQ7PCF3_9HYPO|nr:hypothetical protein E4U57_000703 [Claviceps arundinis]
MSDDLLDEVEAINSIYGPGSLTPTTPDASSAQEYILKLPADEAFSSLNSPTGSSTSSSLRVHFPDSYPSRAPIVIGTHHSSGGVKGAGAKDLELFRTVLGDVFQEGCVCLFDAVEEFTRRRTEALEEREEREEPSSEEGGAAAAAVAAAGETCSAVTTKGSDAPGREDGGDGLNIMEMDPPYWILSEVLVENKSTFVARVARVSSPEEAKRYIAYLLATDKKTRGATHNITAWRIRAEGPAGAGTGLQFQDCDDDGETAAGGRLLHLLQVMDVWGVVVVVSRWFGGVKLGPRRFAVINGVARDGLVRAGVVREKEEGRDKGKKRR